MWKTRLGRIHVHLFTESPQTFGKVWQDAFPRKFNKKIASGAKVNSKTLENSAAEKPKWARIQVHVFLQSIPTIVMSVSLNFLLIFKHGPIVYLYSCPLVPPSFFPRRLSPNTHSDASLIWKWSQSCVSFLVSWSFFTLCFFCKIRRSFHNWIGDLFFFQLFY